MLVIHTERERKREEVGDFLRTYRNESSVVLTPSYISALPPTPPKVSMAN